MPVQRSLRLGMASALFSLLPFDSQESLATTSRFALTEAQESDIRVDQDPNLVLLLKALEEKGLSPATTDVTVMTGAKTVWGMRLTGKAPSEVHYLYYLPKDGLAYFLRIGGEPKRREMRLWRSGGPELLVSQDEVILYPEQTPLTFRLGPEVETPLRQMSAADLTPGEILACIGRTLGWVGTPTPARLESILAQQACNASVAFEIILVACSCLSVSDPTDAAAAVGCYFGMQKLISCGWYQCQSTPQPTPSPAPSTCTITTMSVNSTVSGTWGGSCRSTHRSGSYARFYSFTLSSRSTVTIDLTSSADTYLYLLRGSGTSGSVIDEDDDGGDGYNSRIVATLDSGTYTIEATTYDAGVTGSYQLSLRR